MSAPGPFLLNVSEPTTDSTQYVVAVADWMTMFLTPWSYVVCRYASVAPAYVLLSAKYASTAGIDERTLACAADLFARSRNFMYEGIAIASRIPMMMITTRSSIRVKPPSFRLRLILWLSLASIEEFLLLEKGRWLTGSIDRSAGGHTPVWGICGGCHSPTSI